MSKRPEDRFPSIDAFLAALAEASPRNGAAGESGDQVTEILPPPGAEARGGRPSGSPRRRLRLGGRGARLLAAAIVVGSGAAFLGAVVSGEIDVDGGPGEPVRLAAVRDHDPYAGDGEHPELVAAATDGKRSTYWQTETYGSFEKPGVGVVLDARSRRELGEVTLVTDTPGFRALVRAGDSPSGPFDRASEEQTVGRQTTFALEAPARRYYLLWITELDGVARVNEVRARA